MINAYLAPMISFWARLTIAGEIFNASPTIFCIWAALMPLTKSLRFFAAAAKKMVSGHDEQLPTMSLATYVDILKQLKALLKDLKKSNRKSKKVTKKKSTPEAAQQKAVRDEQVSAIIAAINGSSSEEETESEED